MSSLTLKMVMKMMSEGLWEHDTIIANNGKQKSVVYSEIMDYNDKGQFVVALYKSSSGRGTYEVIFDDSGNRERVDNLACNCRGWILHGNRVCVHTLHSFQKLLHLREQMRVVEARARNQKHKKLF